jgi:hypothetical protein
MSKKLTNFKELGQLYGYQEFAIFYMEILSSNGLRGIKILRIESEGKVINTKEFMKQNRLDPQVFEADFIGVKGYPIDGRIKIKKIKLRKQQEQLQENQK